MKTPLLIVLAALLLLAACGTPEPTACTADAQQCSDGSYVGRVPPSCEFAPCPPPDRTTNANVTPILNTTEIKLNVTPNVTNTTPEGNLSGGKCDYTSRERNYVQHSAEACATVRFTCQSDREYFADPCGCGCALKPNITETTTEPVNCEYNQTGTRYVQQDPNSCRSVLFQCNGRNERAFTNECGCGCTTEPMTGVTTTNQTAVQTPCETPRPEACTKEYNPACGWFNASIQCIKYPCAQTYGNSCTACSDEKVANWTPGECPSTFNTTRGY